MSNDPNALGAWLICAAAVIGIIHLGLSAAVNLQKLRTSKPASEEHVTRAELDKDLARIDSDLRELRTYTRDRLHAQGNKLHAINLRIVYMTGILTQIADKQNITLAPPPTISTDDEA